MKLLSIDVPSISLSLSSQAVGQPDVELKAIITMNFTPEDGPKIVTEYLRPYAHADRIFIGYRPLRHLTEVVCFCVMDVPMGNDVTRVVLGTASDYPNEQVKRFQELVDRFNGEFIIGAGVHPQNGMRIQFMDPTWAMEVSKLYGPKVIEALGQDIGIENLLLHHEKDFRRLARRAR